MIFVTVGTHEQQFNRLVECIDNWAENQDEEVVVQTGYCNFEPKNCRWKKLFSYNEMEKNVEAARIVITHGGPSSFIAPLQIGKTPIVVPRKKKFDEHVNDHQVKFCQQVAERMGTILVVEDVKDLPNVIERYEDIVAGMKKRNGSNNDRFCKELRIKVNELFIK